MSTFDKIYTSVVSESVPESSETVQVTLNLKKSMVDKLEKMTKTKIQDLLERDINDQSEWFLDLYEDESEDESGDNDEFLDNLK